ncbi:uncharacterized protein LOC142579518 isoform X2 [Dermacentor variabilis]|uniref:uncharacterized protein LOC142579518 isoform X2 n=1 Tax=Dermacentor variabilis TaxID=34621 RepID=UPI003F5B19D9
MPHSEDLSETFTLNSPELSRKYGEKASLQRSPDDSPHQHQRKAARQSSLLFVENVRRMDTKAGSPANNSIERYFNSIIDVTPTRTDVQGLIGIPQHSPVAISEASQASVQPPRAREDNEPEQHLLTVDPLVAKEPDDIAVVNSPQRKVSRRIAIAFPYNIWTSDLPAGVDNDDNVCEQTSADSEERKLKHPDNAGSSSNGTKLSSYQVQGRETCNAPGNQNQSRTNVQENESLGDCTPRFNLRSNRPGVVIPQAATVNKFKTKSPNVSQLGDKNASTAADLKQKGSKMADSSKLKCKKTRIPSTSSSSTCGSQKSPVAISEASQASVQTTRAREENEPDQHLLMVDPLVAKEPDDIAVVNSPQRKVSRRIAIAFPHSGWTSDLPAGVDNDDNVCEQPSTDSAKRKLKHPNNAGSSSNGTKLSSYQDQETETCNAPGNQNQSRTNVQENESLADHTPRFNLRRKRPGVVVPQAATVNKLKTKSPNVSQLGNKNASTAADLKQEGSKMAGSSKLKCKKIRIPSPSSSSSCGSQKGHGSKPFPLISRDLWSSASHGKPLRKPLRKPRKPLSSLANRAFPEPASSLSNTHEQWFMREVFPELVKKNSVWVKFETPFVQDSSRSFWSPQTPCKSPLAVPVEARPNGPNAHHEGAAEEKNNHWSAQRGLRSHGFESNKRVGPTKKSEIKAASALMCGTGLQRESVEVAKNFEESQGKAVLPANGDSVPVSCETLGNLGAENEPFQSPRKKQCASKFSLAIDSRLETVKPRINFWQIPGRSLNKTTQHDKSRIALLKVDKEKALPEAPATSPELLDSKEEENIGWIKSLWKQRKSALATASPLRSRKVPSTYPNHKVWKPPVHGKKSDTPIEPPKGGLQQEAKDAIVQTSELFDVQQEVNDAIVQTSFLCMIGKSVNLSKTGKKCLREALHIKEEEVEFMDLSAKQALGNGVITFGHYFSTDTTTFGVMRLDPSCEKAMSANNDHDMFLYAVDTGVNITTLGGTWMLLQKGSAFYISRGLPFTLKNLNETMVKILYVLTEPSKADPVT